MDESSVINKISHESQCQITEATKVSYFIGNNKTWDICKLNSIMLNYIVDKITSIFMPVMIFRMKSFSNLPPMKIFNQNSDLAQ